MTAGQVAGRKLFACELLIPTSFRKQAHNQTLANHVIGVMVAHERKQEAAGNESGLEAEDWEVRG